MYTTKFYIIFEYGYHRVDIETTQEDYYKVINDMSKEFELHFQSDVQENGRLSESVYFENYLGDKVFLAFSLDVEV